MKELTEFLHSQLTSMRNLLGLLVSIESQTDDKDGVDRVANVIARELSNLGADTTRVSQPVTGDHVLGVFNRGGGEPIILILHMDTVYPAGTLAERPIR